MPNWQFCLKIKSTMVVFIFTRLGDSALVLQFLAQWMDLKFFFKLQNVNHFYIVVTFSMSQSAAEI